MALDVAGGGLNLTLLSHYLEVGFGIEQHPQAAAHHGVVVGQHDPDWGRRTLARVDALLRILAVVWRTGCVCSWATPPRAAIPTRRDRRSAMRILGPYSIHQRAPGERAQSDIEVRRPCHQCGHTAAVNEFTDTMPATRPARVVWTV